LLTASEFDRIITPTLKIADNVKSRARTCGKWPLSASAATSSRNTSATRCSAGKRTRSGPATLYSKHYAPVEQCGFVTNNKWGFTLGCSPDGLVGDDGMIEVKSRCQKFQVETIVEGKMPDDFLLQVQGELLVTQRKWCDFISYSAGLPMIVIPRVPRRAGAGRDRRRSRQIREPHQRGRRRLCRDAGERCAADPNRTND
jgi:hypothetical protein